MRRMLSVLVAVLFLAVATVGCQRWTRDTRATSGEVGHNKFDCPNHPGQMSDRPGNCSVCGNKMVNMKSQGKPTQGCDCSEDMPGCKCPHCQGKSAVCPCEDDEKDEEHEKHEKHEKGKGK